MPSPDFRLAVPAKTRPRLVNVSIQKLIDQAGIEHLNEMQNLSIPRIRSGSNLLIVAPTGSGKTEAALLPVLQGLSSGTGAGIRALYITPLRALNRDMIDRVHHLVSSTGLSAAVRHGDTPPSERRKQAATPPDILMAPLEKQYEYRVEWPRPIDKDFETARDFYITPEAAAGLSAIDDTLGESRSTLVFVNARPLAELLGSRLSMLRQDVAVHHGSLPREERERVEAGFKGGDIKGLVSTSTLELGIDIGTVDQVVQYNSPRQVTSLIQRVGRSGHKLDRTSRGLVLAVSSDDAIESLAAVQAARDQDLEPLHVHRLALDVLAHQIVGAALDQGGTAPWSEVLSTIRSSEPFRELEDLQADRVAEFMAHLGNLRQEGDKIRVSPKGRRYYFENLSTIRDERR